MIRPCSTLAHAGVSARSRLAALLADNGSVQNIPEIPADLKALYRTAWEMKMRALIVRAARRTHYAPARPSAQGV